MTPATCTSLPIGLPHIRPISETSKSRTTPIPAGWTPSRIRLWRTIWQESPRRCDAFRVAVLLARLQQFMVIECTVIRNLKKAEIVVGVINRLISHLRKIESAGRPTDHAESDYKISVRFESNFKPYERGDLSRDGKSVYAPVASDEDRRRISEDCPPGSFPPSWLTESRPTVGMICTIYNPTNPIVRRSARIVDILENGRRLLVQREYATGKIEFTRRKAGIYRVPGLRGQNSDTLAVGIDDSTWLSFKRWHPVNGLSHGERWR